MLISYSLFKTASLKPTADVGSMYLTTANSMCQDNNLAFRRLERTLIIVLFSLN